MLDTLRLPYKCGVKNKDKRQLGIRSEELGMLALQKGTAVEALNLES